MRPIAAVLMACAVALATSQAVAAEWETRAPMPTPRAALAGAQLDGIVYALGGYVEPFVVYATNEAYNPATDSWTPRAPMSTPRYVPGAAATGGRLYVVGGNNGGTILSSVEAYDPASNTWTSRASMPTARSNVSAVAANGLVYALGGGYYGSLNVVEAYHPLTDSWAVLAPMPTSRLQFAAVETGGAIYAMGGFDESNPALGSLAVVEAYDIATNTWSARAPLPTARQGLVGVVIDGLIYAIGGNRNGTYHATVEVYDPVTNTWNVQPPMPSARNVAAGAVVDGIAHVFGGHGADNSYLASHVALVPEEELPQRVEECRKDGWRAFGIFRNQGDCVSFVVTHGRNGPTGP